MFLNYKQKQIIKDVLKESTPNTDRIKDYKAISIVFNITIPLIFIIEVLGFITLTLYVITFFSNFLYNNNTFLFISDLYSISWDYFLNFLFFLFILLLITPIIFKHATVDEVNKIYTEFLKLEKEINKNIKDGK